MRTTHHDIELTFTDVDNWATFSRSHGQRAMWDAIADTDHDTVKAIIGDHLEQARGTDGLIHLRQQVRYTLALCR